MKQKHIYLIRIRLAYGLVLSRAHVFAFNPLRDNICTQSSFSYRLNQIKHIKKQLLAQSNRAFKYF